MVLPPWLSLLQVEHSISYFVLLWVHVWRCNDDKWTQKSLHLMPFLCCFVSMFDFTKRGVGYKWSKESAVVQCKPKEEEEETGGLYMVSMSRENNNNNKLIDF